MRPYLNASSSSFRQVKWANRERGKQGAQVAAGDVCVDRVGEEEDAIVLYAALNLKHP